MLRQVVSHMQLDARADSLSAEVAYLAHQVTTLWAATLAAVTILSLFLVAMGIRFAGECQRLRECQRPCEECGGQIACKTCGKVRAG